MTINYHYGFNIILFTIKFCASDTKWHIAKKPHLPEAVVDMVFSTMLEDNCTVIAMMNRREEYYDQIKERMSWGAAVFEIDAHGSNANITLTNPSQVVKQARQLRLTLACVAVLVVSDDPAFLNLYAESAVKGRLLIWSNKLVLLTRLQINQLHGVHQLLSITNSVALIMQERTSTKRVNVYVYLPYTPPETKPLRVAAWSEHQGLTLTSQHALFPDKYMTFISAPHFLVAAVPMVNQELVSVADPEAPGGRRLEWEGASGRIVHYFAQGSNFTYSYVKPDDDGFGNMMPNGTWNGMVEMILKSEADWALGPFILTEARYQVIKYAWPLDTDHQHIIGVTGTPEIEPWNFLLPLTPEVWLGIGMSMVVIAALLAIMFAFMHGTRDWFKEISSYTTKCIRITLQQDLTLDEEWRSWERMLVGLWMLSAMVVIKSYGGNLRALLSVRHIPQPFQSLEDVLDSQDVTMIVLDHSAQQNIIRSATSGLYKEVGDREDVGQLIFRSFGEFYEIVTTLVERGDHVLIANNHDLSNLMATDYTLRGVCKFYLSREGYLQYDAAPITQIDDPLERGLTRGVMNLHYFGLYKNWYMDSVANSSKCRNLPKKIVVSTSMSMTNSWGMFVILLGGWVISAVVVCLELLLHKILRLASERNN